MNNYHVEWEIDLSADDPKAAARLARSMQQDPNGTATVFDVYLEDGDGEPTRIDLMEAGDVHTYDARTYECDDCSYQSRDAADFDPNTEKE